MFAAGFVVESDTADPTLVDEAVAAAAAADVAVVFLGLPPSWESEGYDRSHMDLPAAQVELLEAVAAVNPRVVVVLSNGGAVTVTPWQHHAPAVLEGWLLGQAGGSATADLLLGVTSPIRAPRRDPPGPATRTTPPSAPSPASTDTSATARACSSGTAGTTPTGCPSPTPSVTDCPTRPSPTAVLPSTSWMPLSPGWRSDSP